MLTNRWAALLLLLSLSSFVPACGSEDPASGDPRDEDEGTDDEATEDDAASEDDEDEDDDDDDGPAVDGNRADSGGKKDAGGTKPPVKGADAGPAPKGDGGGGGGSDAGSDAGAKDSGTPAPTDTANGMCCDDGNCICRGEDPTASSLEGMGPYKVASYDSGFKDGQQFLGATIYYPEGAEPPLSGVVFCPGFTALKSALADYGPLFASNGMVLMIIDTNTVLDAVDVRAGALMDALDSLKAENDREGSPLKGKLSKDRYGLGGWSMGGGATWISTGKHPELKTGVTLAGHHATAGGASAVASKVMVPTLMLAGASDTAILGGGNQSQDAYAAIPDGTPKIVYEQTGVDHFGLNSPVMNKPAGKYVLAFEKTFLEGDERYRKFLLEEGPNASTWTSNIE